MKRLFFYAFVFIAICLLNEVKAQGHFNTPIGKIENGKVNFILDKENTKRNWAKVIAENSGLNLSFETLTIEENNSNYFLVAIDSGTNSTSKIDLVLKGGTLFEARTNGGGYSITCSGCTSTGPSSSNECVPEKEPGGIWYCTACSQGNCTKSITTSTSYMVSEEIKRE